MSKPSRRKCHWQWEEAVDALRAALPPAPHGIDVLLVPAPLQQRILEVHPPALLWFAAPTIPALPAAAVTAALRADPGLVARLPVETLQALLPCLIELLRTTPRALRFVPSRLLEDTPQLVDLALAAAPEALRYVPLALRSERRCRDAPAVAREKRALAAVQGAPGALLERLVPELPVEVAATHPAALPLLASQPEALLRVPAAINAAVLADPVTAMRHLPHVMCQRHPVLLWNALFGAGAAAELFDQPWDVHRVHRIQVCRFSASLDAPSPRPRKRSDHCTTFSNTLPPLLRQHPLNLAIFNCFFSTSASTSLHWWHSFAWSFFKKFTTLQKSAVLPCQCNASSAGYV